MRRNVIAPTLIAALAIGCGDSSGPSSGGQVGNQNFLAEVSLNIDLDATARTTFRVEGINGNIDVVGVAGTETFMIRGERQVWSESVADAQDYLDRLEVVITELGNEILIRTVQPSNTGGRNLVVNYQLSVPARLIARLVNLNGNVTARLMDDDVTVNNTNGNVTLDDILGDQNVMLVNGNVESQTPVLAQGGVIDLETVNGNVVLDIPQNTSAQFTANLVNGTISVSGLLFQGPVSSTPTSLTGTLGGGQGIIDLRTVNGNIQASGF
jgi:predicted RNA-binding protein